MAAFSIHMEEGDRVEAKLRNVSIYSKGSNSFTALICCASNEQAKAFVTAFNAAMEAERKPVAAE